jgi:threonine/homoserine efflux transporter RhtA
MHALSHLRSYIFTAVMNARIVFAALLSMLLLDRRVSGEQWRAIVIIVCAATVLCLEDAQVHGPIRSFDHNQAATKLILALSPRPLT